MKPPYEFIIRTEASHEKRHWVRLTKFCNNHCIFCLDSDSQDGSCIEKGALIEEIKTGIKTGAKRLILSGGEPTIHPQFLEIVAESSRIGYRWIQVITNGRRFAYPEFTRRAVNAGVNEVTVSIHGHTPSTHDSLTMAPGSFNQAVKGIKNLLSIAKCHVSVDIVMNKQNINSIDKTIEYFHSIGINEFDLLYIQPFGRAWKESRSILLEKSDAVHIKRAINKARSLGCWVWTNRVPPEFLEGMEDLIQDPHKIIDDVHGRKQYFYRFLTNRKLPDCYGDRCKYCILRNFCLFYFNLLEITGLLNSPAFSPPDQKSAAITYRITRIQTTDDIDKIKEINKIYFSKNPPVEIEFIKPISTPLKMVIPKLLATINPNARITIHMDSSKNPVEQIKDLQKMSKKLTIVTSHNIAPLIKSKMRSGTKLFVYPQGSPGAVEKLKFIDGIFYFPTGNILEDYKNAIDLNSISIPSSKKMIFINVPFCLSRGRSRWRNEIIVSSDWFDKDLLPDCMKIAESYIKEFYYVKSSSCIKCRYNNRCKGMHIDYIRIFGFASLKPM